jgi:hypothetical protein
MKMKFLLGATLVLSLSLGFGSCKSKKAVASKSASQNEIGTILENMPCEDAGRSDKNNFRSSSMSTSSDLQLSKEKALLLAKQRLVTLINSNTKSVTDRYVNEREFTDASEFEQKFENLTREVADETLNNIVVICEKSSVLDNKQYRSFIAIEVSKEDIMNGFQRKVSKTKSFRSITTRRNLRRSSTRRWRKWQPRRPTKTPSARKNANVHAGYTDEGGDSQLFC